MSLLYKSFSRGGNPKWKQWLFMSILAAAQVGFCAAPSNSVTIRDTSGAGQSNMPVTISRFFADTDIASYPQPRIAGVPLSVWQSDVKTRWKDGTVAHALISFTVNLSAN